jgi:hypothetical protein
VRATDIDDEDTLLRHMQKLLREDPHRVLRPVAMRSHHRTVRGAVISAGALVVVALVASTALAKRPAPQPIRIKAPAAGKYSITAVSLTAKKAPRLRVVGRLPSDLAVALGVA